MKLITLSSDNITARINLENQHLGSLVHNGREWMHGASLPKSQHKPEDKLGWQQSELVMFPVVGPVKDNLLNVDGVAYPMAQHGISRHIPWELDARTTSSVRFKQEYQAGTPVANSKITTKLVWPFSYRLEKTYALTGTGLLFTVAVRNNSGTTMPYDIGWHPAFKLVDPHFTAHTVDGKQTITLPDVQAASLQGAMVIECQEVSMIDRDGGLTLTTDAPYVMLWSPSGSKMVCIEPTTQHPVWAGTSSLHGRGLMPGEIRSHETRIKIS